MDLKINVENLPKNGGKWDFCFEEKEIKVPEVISEVSLELEIHKSGNIYNVKGNMEYKLGFTCSRCLEEFRKQEKREFQLEFKKESVYALNGKLKREMEEDKEENLVINNCIDLGPFLRDELILSVPMKPLCSENCKGLCPICGTNLNKTQCEHYREEKKKHKIVVNYP